MKSSALNFWASCLLLSRELSTYYALLLCCAFYFAFVQDWKKWLLKMRLTSGFSVGKSGMALFSSPSSHRSQSSIQAHQHERDRWRVMRINHRIKATAPSCPAPPIKPKWLTASGRLFWTPERCFEHFEKEKCQGFAWKSTFLINSVFVSTLQIKAYTNPQRCIPFYTT